MALIESEIGDWTAADLVERFGPIPLSRIRHHPPPGTATEQDAIEIHDREDRLQLVDGVLVEKTMGTYESYLAVLLARLLGNFVEQKRLGIVLGADGMMRLAPGLVRIPDVAFISWQRLPGGKVPRSPLAELAPDLAVEVISKGNTREEMNRKLGEYFASGVGEVWYVYPGRREFHVYSSPDQCQVLGPDQTVRAGQGLPGFVLAINDFFQEPGETGGAESK